MAVVPSVCLAMLDIITILLFGLYSSRPLHHASIELLFRLGGSLFLLWLCTRSSRSSFLLCMFGDDPWRLGWETLWSSPVLYVSVRAHMARSHIGPLVYFGETTFFHRRCCEHVLRLLKPTGSTQQPLYTCIRRDLTQDSDVVSAVCQWLFFPIIAAPLNACARKENERALIHAIGTLNPPRVYAVLDALGKRRSGRHKNSRLFDSSRPFKRLRSSHRVDSISHCVPAKPDSHKAELQQIAAFLAGHRGENVKRFGRAAWSLSPRDFVYVSSRVDHEEGWRRRRGLHLLRLISRYRRDLVPPISLVHASLIWTGVSAHKPMVKRTFLSAISQWRSSGYFLPILRHAKFLFTWKRTSSLCDVLSTSKQFMGTLGMDFAPQWRQAKRGLA